LLNGEVLIEPGIRKKKEVDEAEEIGEGEKDTEPSED